MKGKGRKKAERKRAEQKTREEGKSYEAEVEGTS